MIVATLRSKKQEKQKMGGGNTAVRPAWPSEVVAWKCGNARKLFDHTYRKDYTVRVLFFFKVWES